MAEQKTNDRTESARLHDDHDLIEGAERAPSQSGRGGGSIATEIGTRDEQREVAGATRLTGVQKSDKVQPVIPTRADNEGANG